jgi:DNA-binding protein HU-beta
VIDEIFDPADGLIATGLREDGNVGLAGFGSFSLRARPERKGRDPRTGRELTVPARNVCTFTPRKGLRSSMKDMVGA